MAPWKLPLIVIAIAVPIALAFYGGGPGVGVAAGALMGVGIVVVGRSPATTRCDRRVARRTPSAAACWSSSAARSRTRRAIGEIAEAAAVGEEGPGAKVEVLVLAPARIGFLDRWASDLEGARREAQRRLVITVASMAKAGVSAEARVGDEDLVQAVEDQLQSFPATEVILATGDAGEDPAGEAAAVELERRLRAEFRRLLVSGPAAR